jgi:sugar phosphate isomerase/epimerase
MLLRLAVATSVLNQPLRHAIVSAAAAGANGVQLDARNEVKPADYGETARRQLLHELGERGLKVASLAFPLRHSLHAIEHLDARLAAVREAMEFAALLKASVVVVRAGRVLDDPSSAENQRLADVLDEFARLGNHLGVTLSVTPAAEPPGTLAAILETIKSGPIGIDFDPAACAIAGRGAPDDLRTLHAYVTHVQVRDAVRDVDGTGLETPVGRGEVDWPELLAIIGEMNYQGWLTVRRTGGDDVAGDCARAIKYIRNVVTNG